MRNSGSVVNGDATTWKRRSGASGGGSKDDVNSMSASRTTLTKAEKKDLARPLARKDVFYSGSVTNLPEYQSKKSLGSYRQSIISLPRAGQPTTGRKNVDKNQGKLLNWCTMFMSEKCRCFDIQFDSNLDFNQEAVARVYPNRSAVPWRDWWTFPWWRILSSSSLESLISSPCWVSTSRTYILLMLLWNGWVFFTLKNSSVLIKTFSLNGTEHWIWCGIVFVVDNWHH